MRPIDAQEYAKELVNEMEWPGRHPEFISAIECAMADLSDMPTLEVRPVVHAKWMMGLDIADYEYGVCSACGYYEWHAFPCNYTPKFCPECGATMDGKEYEEE